ncbi:MAG: PD40 domain-containing protein [Anaerolineales bacterium]|nr:PD40 domain-containing protein [Anaerolineales bacterium]
MLASAFRLAGRLGRLAAKSGAYLGDTAGALFFPARPAPAALPRRLRSAAPTAAEPGVIHVRLQRRHVPVIGLLLIVNVGLIAAATLLINRAAAPAPLTPPVTTATLVAPTEFAVAALDPADVENIAGIDIAVTPAPAGPTPTAPPNPLSLGGTLYYAFRHNGYTNLYAKPLGVGQPVRLTAGPWDDRDPAISPDGLRLAFASHRDGSWNLYALDLTNGQTVQLTSGLDFKANPAWSPDGQYLVFELYRNANLDIALVSAAGGDLIPITSNPAADYEPAWSPQGREIVWVSMRSGNPDLWRMSLDAPDESAYTALTNTPLVQESDPAYSPNAALLAYTDAASPYGQVWTIQAAAPDQPPAPGGQGLYPTWSPEGSSLASVSVQEGGPDLVLVAPLAQEGLAQIAHRSQGGRLRGLAWSGVALPAQLPAAIAQLAQVSDAPNWSEALSAPPAGDPPYTLVALPDVTVADARLNDRVDEAFTGLRRTTARLAGWDFLKTIDNALIGVDAPQPPSIDYNSWLKTGRAFDVAEVVATFGYLALTREDYVYNTYWRLWLLAAAQDGTQGEPLRRPPWDLTARYSGRPQPYDQGGEFQSVLPAGYYVDFTALAEDYGWQRVPALGNWRVFYDAVMYRRFEHRDGLTWLAAMREVYSAAAVATRTPVPSPTNTPTVTQTPTRTITPTRTPTKTPTPSATWRPTRTLTPTVTRRPTITLTPSRTPRPSATPTGTWYTQTPTATATFPATSTLIAEP